MSDDTKYKVGFGKPPEATRFKKGQSGNPAGRPKGAKSNKRTVKRMLEMPMPVKIGDQIKTMSTFELSLHRVSEGVRKAEKGAVNKAIQLGLELDKHEEAKAAAAAAAPGSQQQSEPLTAEEQEIILEYLAAQKALKEAF